MSFDEAISLPEDLYTRLLAKSERISIVGVSQELQEVLDLVLDAVSEWKLLFLRKTKYWFTIHRLRLKSMKKGLKS